MANAKHPSAYDRHWQRLAELLGPEEAAAERARVTADEKADRQRKRLAATIAKHLPRLRRELAAAEAAGRESIAARLRVRIAYREQQIAEAGHD